MATLHLVNHTHAVSRCLSVAAEDDAVLLLEDGTYAAVSPRAPDRPVYVLEPDVRARGLGGRLGSRVEVIDDARFVTLVEAHQPVVTWR